MFDLSNPFIKLLLSVIAIAAVILIATRKFNYSLKNDLLLVASPFKSLLLWGSIWIAWMLATDFVFNWRGPFDFQPWSEQSPAASVTRILAVGILGPIAEELIFRGLLLKRLAHFKVNPFLSILITSALWSAIHIDYSIGILLLLFINGIILGFSVYFSRSLVIPIVLHIIWNLYSVW